MRSSESNMRPHTPQLTFNDLRDNESRGARHKQRTSTRLQALSISSMMSNFAPTPQIELTAADLGKVQDVHCRPAVFEPTTFSCSEADAGIDPEDLVRRRHGWSATNPQALALNQQSLCTSLMQAEEKHWPTLWLASCFRSHMLIGAKNQCFYIVMATRWLLFAYELYCINGVYYVTCEADCFRSASCRS